MHAASPRSLLAMRGAMLARIRRFFAAREVIEVDTPHLGDTTTPDPAIASFEVHAPLRPHWRGYLQTSPEFAMKRLLAAGAGDIYQLAHVFRDGEAGQAHLPEFMLLEWYRLGFDEHRLMDEIEALLAEVLPALCSTPGERISYREAFISTCGIDPGEATQGELAAALLERGVQPPDNLLRRELLDLAMAVLVIPSLGHARACFVHDYPADQAALAALNPGSPPTAARFEVFVAGMELGNGFRELTDAAEQRRRFAAELAIRQAAGQPTFPADEALLAALEQGLPACAGVAMGVDRILMLACGARDIREIVPLPTP